MKLANQIGSAKVPAIPRAPQARKDAGAAAVEFILVLPILLALVFGIINFGFIFATQISLNNSARDAARAGVVTPLGGTAMDCSSIAHAARDGSVTIGVNPINVGVTVTSATTTTFCTLAAGSTTVGTNAGNQLCTATSGQLLVALQYTVVSPVPLVPPSSVNLKATGAFQCEYS